MEPTKIPRPGLGTGSRSGASATVETIRRALEIGYRHFDTAERYGTERVLGQGIRRSSVPPEEVFIATKVPADSLSYDGVLEHAQGSRDRIGVNTIDLLYIHWPAVTSGADRFDPTETLPAFDRLVDSGVINHVGVANFSVELIEEATRILDQPILAHQFEMHPLLPQERLVSNAMENGMVAVAYCPLARGRILGHPTVVEIGAETGATPAQVALAWSMARGDVVPIPKTSGAHLTENLAAASVELASEAVERIGAIEDRCRVVDSEKGPWNW